MVSADVAVVGAGPAGAWAARCLARHGARVLLIDGSHPREKPCGGGVTGRALDLVAPAVDVDRLPRVTIKAARFSAVTSPAAAHVPLPSHALVVANRAEFDGLILAEALRAGTIWLEARVTDVRSGAGGFQIETTAGSRHASLLIGADGATSLVRRRLAGPFRRDQLTIATGVYAHGTTSHEIIVEWISEPPGYIWSFPRPTHLAIGVCVPADGRASMDTLRRMTCQWMQRTGVAAGARLEPYSWPIPTLSAADLGALAVSGSRWFLVGDAAGLVDPMTREGIYFALQSGQWVADAIAADNDAPQRYAGQVRDRIGMELTRAAEIKDRFFQPRFTRLLIEALRESRAITEVMADFIAGRQAYRGLPWRLATTCELGLAARLLLSGTRIRRAPES